MIVDRRWLQYFAQADQALQRQIRRAQILDSLAFYFYRLPIMLGVCGLYLIWMAIAYVLDRLFP